METPFQLSSLDGKKIFGTLTQASASGHPSEKLLVFVHGLGADSNRHIFYNGARYFSANEIDTCRFDFHPGGAEGRFLRQTTLETQTADLESVLNHFRGQYKSIIVAAHSLGGIVALQANPQLFDALILIACAAKDVLHETQIITPYNNEYIANYGVQYLLSTAMYDSMKSCPSISQFAQKIAKPLLVTCGTLDFFSKYAQQYFDAAATKTKALHFIDGAGHSFNEAETEAELFKISLGFINSVK